MTNDQVHTALVRWLKSVTAVKVIKAHESGKVPALPYIMVNFTGFVPLHEHPQDIVYTEGDDPPGDDLPPITATPIMDAEWRFSVHAYGDDPTDILRPVVSASKLSQMQEPLLPGLVIHDVSQIRNVPEWINNAWQPRAQMDVFLHGLTKDGFVIDVIEHTDFDFTRA